MNPTQHTLVYRAIFPAYQLVERFLQVCAASLHFVHDTGIHGFVARRDPLACCSSQKANPCQALCGALRRTVEASLHFRQQSLASRAVTREAMDRLRLKMELCQEVQGHHNQL